MGLFSREHVYSKLGSAGSRSRSRIGRSLVGLAVAAMLLGAAPARAQIDPFFGAYLVYINGVEAGQVYRVETSRTVYTEHWVLYPGYVFPSGENRAEMQVRAGTTTYRNAHDFLSAVFKPGCQYAKAYTIESTTLPNGRVAASPSNTNTTGHAVVLATR